MMAECDLQFTECEPCAAKPGSPTLCSACLHNRRVIEELRAQRNRARAALGLIAKALELAR